MMKYSTHKELSALSDNELIRFFAETYFYGRFSRIVKSKNKDRFKGNISNIRLSTGTVEYITGWLNVPMSASDIDEGLCKFKIWFDVNKYRLQGEDYTFSIIGSTLSS